MSRPGPLRWLRYAAGGRLPARYNAWVLHDTTCATWVLRHLARAAVLLAVPAIALLLLLPGGMPIRVLTVVTVAGCSFLLLAILTNEITERRVQKAGYPGGRPRRRVHIEPSKASAGWRNATASASPVAADRPGRRPPPRRPAASDTMYGWTRMPGTATA